MLSQLPGCAVLHWSGRCAPTAHALRGCRCPPTLPRERLHGASLHRTGAIAASSCGSAPLALGGLTLPDVLAGSRPRPRRIAPPDTSVILFWMWGGPSQLETWDCKPDAPSEYRGPLRPIHTTVPGLDVCEVFPRQAKLGHRISLIRSLHHGMSSHNDGSIEVLTGKTPVKEDPTSTAKSDHPDFGMIASQLRGAAAERAARLRRHSARAVHGAADVSGHDARGLRRRQSGGARTSSRRICRSTPASTAAGWTIARGWSRSSIAIAAAHDLHGAVAGDRRVSRAGVSSC